MAVINKQELDILKELRAKTPPISGAIKSHLVGGFGSGISDKQGS